MIGTPPLLPKRELLTSARGDDGQVHAFYPTATRTLCGLDPPTRGKGRPAAPTCPPCAATARRWHRIDESCPLIWRGFLEDLGEAA